MIKGEMSNDRESAQVIIEAYIIDDIAKEERPAEHAYLEMPSQYQDFNDDAPNTNSDVIVIEL